MPRLRRSGDIDMATKTKRKDNIAGERIFLLVIVSAIIGFGSVLAVAWLIELLVKALLTILAG